MITKKEGKINMNEETNTELDYKRLWTILMKLGLKERFSEIRIEFFMKIANEGSNKFSTEEEMEKIIGESKVFALVPSFVDKLKLAIKEGDEFKHYTYNTQDQDMFIEYFANISSPISHEYIDSVTPEEGTPDYNIDGHILSSLLNDVTVQEGTENEHNQDTTAHMIIISENNNSLDADLYPMVIKHELTHACLFEIKKNILNGYYKTIKTPSFWTDDDIETWLSDIEYLSKVLNKELPGSSNFIEFVCEFLMFESDGQRKIKNPIVESRVPKSVKNDTKPKVTYRTVTPYDRYQEVMDIFDDSYRQTYGHIIESLRELYDDYDKFLESIRM